MSAIREIGTIFVPVSDQERALEFYAGALGFETRAEFTYSAGRHRWIEVAPPGAANTLALVPPTEGRSPGGDAARCAFASADSDAAHARLRDLGVEVDAEIARSGTPRRGLVSDDAIVEDPIPAQFFVRDPDGNRFLIVQLEGPPGLPVRAGDALPLVEVAEVLPAAVLAVLRGVRRARRGGGGRCRRRGRARG